MFVCVWINIYSYIRSSIRWIRLVEAHLNWTEIVIPSEVFSYTYLCTPGYVCWFFSLPRVSFRPLFRCHCFRMDIHMLVWSMHPKLGQTACLLLNIFLCIYTRMIYAHHFCTVYWSHRKWRACSNALTRGKRMVST